MEQSTCGLNENLSHLPDVGDLCDQSVAVGGEGMDYGNNLEKSSVTTEYLLSAKAMYWLGFTLEMQLHPVEARQLLRFGALLKNINDVE